MNKVEISVDVITGKTSRNEVPFSAQELAYSEQVTAQAETEKAQALAIKESAIAKLTALGLTQDEVKAILGTTL
jgi:hypothetical protein